MNGTAALTDVTTTANARARSLIFAVPSCWCLPEFGTSGQ
jgi:hypothetical protein